MVLAACSPDLPPAEITSLAVEAGGMLGAEGSRASGHRLST